MISIIVPIYNGAKGLEKCLASIQQQTFTDFEVILIDDGSTDNSKEIALDFIKNDSRFQYVYQKNQGVSTARNHGLALANGEWISFVDCDDTLKKDFLQDFFTYGKDADLLSQGYELVDKNESFKMTSSTLAGTLSQEQAFLALVENRNFYSYSVNKLYQKAIITKYQLLFSTEISYGEDLLFIYEYLKAASKIYYTPKANYQYIRHEDAVGGTLTKAKIKKRLTYITSMTRIYQDTDNQSLKQALSEKIAYTGVIYRANLINFQFPKGDIQNFTAILKPYWQEFKKQPGKLKIKGKTCLFYIFPKLTKKFTQ